jgi:hypothetical protein
LSIYPNLASHGARGVFDQSNVMTACHGHEGGEVAGHPHLVDRENGAGAIGYGRGNLLGIDIVGPRISPLKGALDGAGASFLGLTLIKGMRRNGNSCLSPNGQKLEVRGYLAISLFDVDCRGYGLVCGA